MIIYKIQNKTNGKSYIGQTVESLQKRRNQHLATKGCRAISNALRKYGSNNFEWTILYEADCIETLNFMEEYYIEKLNTLAPSGYNLQSGGNNRLHSLETRQLMSERRKNMSDETKAKISRASIGRKVSEETKEKISQANKGKHLSNEHKKKISESRRHLSEESILRYSKANKGDKNPFYGKKHSEETLRKMSESAKKRQTLLISSENNIK